MGGTMKGAHGHMHSISSSRRKWSNTYVVMAIVCSVLGCGILGLMGIHRLKERSSFNLLIKERDDQILSLHILLQKEREHVAEAKRKAEEMQQSLGLQRVELGSKMSEMESTISSLREEQRAVETAFQEKQTEANLMREKYDQQSPQVEALNEELRRKQGEIEELKLHLQLGSNTTAMATTTAEAKAGNETSSGNEGIANVDGDEVEATSKKGDEHGDGVEATGKKGDEHEPEAQGSPRRFRGHLRRAKGRRWRLIGKHIQGRRNDALGNSSTGSTLREPEKSLETKMDAKQSEQTGEAISITKPTTEEEEKTDVLGRKRGGEEENGDQDEESEDKEETNEPEF